MPVICHIFYFISKNFFLLLGLITTYNIPLPPMYHGFPISLVLLGAVLVCHLLLIVREYHGVNLIFVVELIGFVMFVSLSDCADKVHLGEKIAWALLVWFVLSYLGMFGLMRYFKSSALWLPWSLKLHAISWRNSNWSMCLYSM